LNPVQPGPGALRIDEFEKNISKILATAIYFLDHHNVVFIFHVGRCLDVEL